MSHQMIAMDFLKTNFFLENKVRNFLAEIIVDPISVGFEVFSRVPSKTKS